MKPNDHVVERGLLSYLLVYPDQIDEVAGLLDDRCFDLLAHREVWRALARLGPTADAVSLQSELARAQVGETTRATLLELSSGYAPIDPLPHARRLRDLAAARACVEAAAELVQEGQGQEADPLGWIGSAATRFASVATVDRAGVSLVPATTLADAHLNAITERARGLRRGMQTGISGYDRLTLGLHVGELLVLAARPGVGKTAIGLQWLMSVAASGVPCAMFSLEMGNVSLLDRIASRTGTIDHGRLRAGTLVPHEMQALLDVHTTLKHRPLSLCDASPVRIGEIRSMARRWRRANPGPQALVVVDYLQLVHPDAKSYSREQDVASISRAAKEMARELDVCALFLAQLNRGSEREQREPTMADLRESGAIEQDADCIVFVHRPKVPDDPDDPDAKPRNGDTGALLIEKNRNGDGAGKRVPIVFEGKYQRFVEP